MKGDFTRGFNPDGKRGQAYRRVLLQQGRALLDSDMAALVEATEGSLRDGLRMAAGTGSPDLGLLVTPGRLLAQFDGELGNRVTPTGGAEAVRDYGAKHLGRLPGLRIGGAGGNVRVVLDAPLPSPTPIRLWARADAGGALLRVNGASANVPGGTGYQPFDATVSGTDLDFQVDPAARTWIALVETREPGPAPLFHAAPGTYAIDGLAFATPGGAWPHIPPLPPPAADAATAQADGPAGTAYLAYVELHERHVTAVEDPGLREQALGAMLDTTTRTRLDHQVKLAPIDPALATPEAIAEAARRVLLPSGRVTLGLATAVPAADPCDLPVPGGYTGPENRLYRLEVHGEASGGGTLFKWSRENGSELFPAAFPSGLAPGAMTSAVTADAFAELRDGDLVELLSEAVERGDAAPGTLGPQGLRRPRRQQGRLLRLGSRGELEGPRPVFDLLDPVTEDPVADLDTGLFGTEGLKLRRWSGLFRHTADATHPLESGIRADVQGTEFEPGDWWQHEARTGAANANGPAQPAPHGPERLFAPLAVLIQPPPGQPMSLVAWLDTRFPRLPEIEADGVSYDGAKAGSDAPTVQEALDELFARDTQGCGEIRVAPNADIRDAIAAIPPLADAHLCLGPGLRDLGGEVLVANLGHITVTGLGRATVLRSPRAVFRFVNCRSVTLAGFSCEATGPGTAPILSIEDCGEVEVRDLSLDSTQPAQHGIAALRIGDPKEPGPGPRPIPRTTRVRVGNCRMRLGREETGILIVGARDATVEDCDIAVSPSPFDLAIAIKAEDEAGRALASRVGRVFLNQLSFKVDDDIFVGGTAVDLNSNDPEPGRRGVALAAWGTRPIRFTTHGDLDANAWEALARANPTAEGASYTAIRQHIRVIRRQLARAALSLDAPGLSLPGELGPRIRAVGAQIDASARTDWGEAGIVIAAPRGPVIPAGQFQTATGRHPVADPLSQSARILRNRIEGFHQGIRLGASDARTGRRQGQYAVLLDVEVTANRILLRAPLFARGRWGILVGNAVTASVTGNRVGIERAEARDDDMDPRFPAVDGIRLWGRYGSHVQIERNDCVGTTDGVRFHSLDPKAASGSRSVWKVGDFGFAAPLPTNSLTMSDGRAEIIVIPI